MALLQRLSHGKVQARPSAKGAVAVKAGRNVRSLRVLAAAQPEKASAPFGLDASEGFFGFNPFAEQWVGRWAMMGFVSSIVVEATTGKGTLAQVGLPSPSPEILTALIVLTVGGCVAGSANTANRLVNKKMTPREMAGYKEFLGLNNQDDYKTVADMMKKKGDFATPNVDSAAIAATRKEGMAADRVLAVEDGSVAAAAASEMKAADGGVLTLSKGAEAAQVAAAAAEMKEGAGPSASAAAAPKGEASFFDEDYDMRYARSIELSNGRAAMLGFLAAVLVEAATGKGIILQLVWYAKMSGLLGPMSGF